MVPKVARAKQQRSRFNMMTDNKQNQLKKAVLIMAGGTGGHIFPALATAQVLRDKGVHIEWIGTKKGLEARLVPEHHYPINYIDIGGLRGKGLKTLVLLPFKLIRAMIQTISVYKKVKPDVVLGMGGFVTAPGGIVGWLLRKPLVLHEQNAIAGLTNKILFTFAKKVYAAFPGAFAETKKLSIIGNPVRKEITQLHKPEQRFEKKWAQTGDKQLNILVIGGSLGAAALNEKLPQALAIIAQSQQLQTSYFDKINVRHQCGDKHLDMTKDNYKCLEQTEGEVNISVEIMPFINDMAKNYTWADLVVCRSGALTVSEIAAVGVASLLVPFPYAVDDHQTANAAYLADEDAAFLIQQNNLSSEKLAELLMSLNQEKLLTMAVNARKLSFNNAAEVVADECLLLTG